MSPAEFEFACEAFLEPLEWLEGVNGSPDRAESRFPEWPVDEALEPEVK